MGVDEREMLERKMEVEREEAGRSLMEREERGGGWWKLYRIRRVPKKRGVREREVGIVRKWRRSWD